MTGYMEVMFLTSKRSYPRLNHKIEMQENTKA